MPDFPVSNSGEVLYLHDDMTSPTILLVLAFQAFAAEPSVAEYAFRWDPGEGGPSSLEAVRGILDGRMKSSAEFAVRYHRLPQDRKWPEGAVAIFRERVPKDGNAEYRLKFRRSKPFVELDVCPAGTEMSYEKDAVFVGADSVHDVYSLSCTGSDPEIAKTLQASPLPCHSNVARYTGRKYRLEIWTLPRNETLLEISHRAGNTAGDQAQFRELVRTLVGAGARPTGASKTELGMECGGE